MKSCGHLGGNVSCVFCLQKRSCGHLGGNVTCVFCLQSWSCGPLNDAHDDRDDRDDHDDRDDRLRDLNGVFPQMMNCGHREGNGADVSCLQRRSCDLRGDGGSFDVRALDAT